MSGLITPDTLEALALYRVKLQEDANNYQAQCPRFIGIIPSWERGVVIQVVLMPQLLDGLYNYNSHQWLLPTAFTHFSLWFSLSVSRPRSSPSVSWCVFLVLPVLVWQPLVLHVSCSSVFPRCFRSVQRRRLHHPPAVFCPVTVSQFRFPVFLGSFSW